MDLLVDDRDAPGVQKILEHLGYLPGQPWEFQESRLKLWRFTRATGEGEEFFLLDILLASTPDFLKIIEKAHKEAWSTGYIRVARKKDLIWMKSLRKSHTDLADIEFLSEENET